MSYTVDNIIKVLTTKDYPIFDSDRLPYNLNIVGIRNSDRISNKFNDTLCTFYKYNGDWHLDTYSVTLDPGIVYREHPINNKGTAIIMPGHYPAMWKVGLHKGKYPALVQNAPCTVARDNNKDAVLDSNIPPYDKVVPMKDKGAISNYYIKDGLAVFTTQTGMFGINCHKSGHGKTVDVNYYSAGCVVFSDNDRFGSFLDMCNAAIKFFGNSFSFTLIDDDDFKLV